MRHDEVLGGLDFHLVVGVGYPQLRVDLRAPARRDVHQAVQKGFGDNAESKHQSIRQ